MSDSLRAIADVVRRGFLAIGGVLDCRVFLTVKVHVTCRDRRTRDRVIEAERRIHEKWSGVTFDCSTEIKHPSRVRRRPKGNNR